MLTNETISEMVRIIREKDRMCNTYECAECRAKSINCDFYSANKDLAKLIQIVDAWSIERPDKEQQVEVIEQSYGSNTLAKRVDHLEKCTEKPMSENKTRLQALLEVLPNIELDDEGYPFFCVEVYDKVQDTQNNYDCSQGCEECKKRFWEAKEK